MEETRKCVCCGRELPLSEFNKDKRMKDGLSSRCRECVNKSQREVWKKRKEKAHREGLAAYTPRELMEELYKRGYKGVLEFTQVHKIDIGNF